MGRLDENTTPSNYPGQSQFQTPTGQQPQEYRFGGVTQAPDTIDDVPPSFEFGNEENQQENYQNEPSERHKTGPSKATNEGLENQENFQQESQPSSPTAQSREPITVAPTSGPQAVHFPPHNAQFPTTRSSASGITPQVRPQAFPPPQGQPQAFPQHGAQPQAFPPPEAFPPDKPGAFPPPQAFPPPEADQIHAFPPQGEPVNFPPHQPVFKQPNMTQFTPATNYSYPAANMNAAMGSPAINPGSPFGQNANMINNYPQGIPVVNQTPTEAWKSSLFDCMDDPENALITACFPCVTFGQIAEIIDQGQTSCGTSGCLYGLIAFCIAMPCLISCGYRTKLRSRLGLVESPAPDWIVHCFCEWCALCQEYRELKGRGLDPAIGWQGNLMQQQMATMTPPMHPMMGR